MWPLKLRPTAPNPSGDFEKAVKFRSYTNDDFDQLGVVLLRCINQITSPSKTITPQTAMELYGTDNPDYWNKFSDLRSFIQVLFNKTTVESKIKAAVSTWLTSVNTISYRSDIYQQLKKI
jgi:hypothetical protein